MEIFEVSLTNTNVEQATIKIEANSAEEAQQAVLDKFHEGTGSYESDFCVVGGHTSVDMGDDEPLTSLRVKKIERLIGIAYGDENAVCDILADLRHYCDANGLNFGHQDSAAYQHYLAELQSQGSGKS